MYFDQFFADVTMPVASPGSRVPVTEPNPNRVTPLRSGPAAIRSPIFTMPMFDELASTSRQVISARFVTSSMPRP